MSELKKRRLSRCAAVLVVAAVLAGFAHVPILRGIASLLIVEDKLQTAAAIVPLAGQTPFREMEAARLYHAGLASLVIVVREATSSESAALQDLGIKKPQAWQLSREVLIQQGVPPNKILVPRGEAVGTLEELQAVYDALQPQNVPVILVTSKYHTRRTRLTWSYVSGGRSQPIVRTAPHDPFDLERWWLQRNFALSVVREYLGLINYYTGFPVGITSAHEAP